ncbi:MAG: heme-binding protein [Gammaproteobacteria bacterium]|jgi:uncharacterized protein GlcG (DUF336 family)
MRGLILVIGFLVSLTAHAEDNAYVTSRLLTATSANKLAVAAEAYCRSKGYQVTVAVVDRFGNLLAFLRNPLSGAHTIQVAQNKAYTAATLQGSTMELGKRVEFLKTLPRISLVGGGLPVRVGGYMYGAIGVSGAPAIKKPGDMDDECARVGVNVIKDTLEFAG